MVDGRLMRGDGWVCCCICGRRHVEPFDQLVVDEHGERWDVCAVGCAAEAGITARLEQHDDG